MIHNWECDRCTHQWNTSCMGEMLLKPDEKKRYSRHLHSGLCQDCFEQLELEEIDGLPLFELSFHLFEKSNRYGGNDSRLNRKYSGSCHAYVSDTCNSDGSIKMRGNFDAGKTSEHEQLYEIYREVHASYTAIILRQRTEKRIELDSWREVQKRGFVFFGHQPRPEGFVGDGPGKQRFEVLFGFDMPSGFILGPHIRENDGTQ